MFIKFIFGTFILFKIVQVSAQVPAVTPQSEVDRLTFTCSQGISPAGPVPYLLVGAIDWSAGAADGKGEFQLLRLNFTEGGRASGEQWMRIARFQLPVEISEDAITQVIRQKNPSATDDLHITWRSAFPKFSPVDHFLVLKGRTFKFMNCQAAGTSRGSFP
jgi:hypothetical protein